MYSRKFTPHTPSNSHASGRGFTIVELLVVIVVIAILAAIVIVSYNGVRDRAITSTMQSELSSALTALKLDHAKTSQFPATLEAANENKGVSFSPDTVVTYVPQSDTASPQTFCLSISRGGHSYVTTQDGQVNEGTCEPPAPVLTYSEEVLADNPSVYWRFQETSGTSVANTATTGAGRALGMTSASAGLGAPGLSGENDDHAWNAPGQTGVYGSRASASWQHVPVFTVEAIIQPDAVNSYRAIVSHDGSGTRSWNFYVRDGKLLVYDFSAGGDIAVGATTLVANQRYHVAMTYSAGTTKLYVNGEEDATRTGPTLRTTASGMPFVVGASYAGTSPPTFLFDGRIDEVAFYDTVITPVRLNAHATAAGL